MSLFNSKNVFVYLFPLLLYLPKLVQTPSFMLIDIELRVFKKKKKNMNKMGKLFLAIIITFGAF